VLLLLAVAVASGRVSLRFFATFLDGLHNTIGITTPSPRQVRWVALAWIASVILIVDMLALLLAYVF